MANLLQVITAAVAPRKAFSSVDNRQGWYPIVRESFPGAWQRNITVNQNAVQSFHAIFACQTLIASDIAKLGIKLVKLNQNTKIWKEIFSPAYSPVLKKPNHFQTRIQFVENWILSKLSRGNTYVLKQRDGRNQVIRMYVLDPNRCRPLVSDEGEVFYELQADNIIGLTQDLMGDGKTTLVVPAREIIHDRWNCLFHPLVGLSPIFACGMAATHGQSIQQNQTKFFENGARPGGVLSAPGRINKDTAARIKEHWEQNFSGDNAGRVAVLGDGLKYEAMSVDPSDSKVVEQLKLTSEIVCSTYHVPPYKIGIGNMPTANNVQALNLEYYTQCLQILIEAFELCLDEGLEFKDGMGTEMDIDNLLRMDTVSLVNTIKEATSAGVMAPNEGRFKLNLEPKAGGDTPYLQQQNYSLAALAKRDAQDDPFGTSKPEPQAPLALPAPNSNGEGNEDDPPTPEDEEEEANKAIAKFRFAGMLTAQRRSLANV